MLDRLDERLLASWLAAQPDGARRIAAGRLLRLVTLALLAQPAAIAVAAWQAVDGYVFVADALTFLSYVAFLGLLRRGASPYALGHLFCLVGTLQTASGSLDMGGLLGAVPTISLLVPIAATLVVGPRAGWVWLFVQITWWSAWVALADPAAAMASLSTSMPSWLGGIVFSLVVTGVLFQGAVTVLVDLEQARQRQLDRLVEELEERVGARTAELRREVAERREAELAAQHANRAKSAFLANMSHELRTPVTTIIGYTEIVQEDVASGSTDSVAPDLDSVLGAANHLLALIDSVLDLSRVESGKIELSLAPLALVDEVVTPVLAMVRPHIDARHNRLELEVEPGVRVVADASATRQILLNLLTNANKFTDAGRLRLQIGRDDDAAVIVVEDTGCGIAPDQLGAIFERFHQAHERRSENRGGTGLGLTISKQLALAMGGALEATSEEGRGSRFVLHLPVAPNGEARALG